MAAMVKYFVQYSDASYTMLDRQYMSGVSSLVDAKWYFESVQSGECTQFEFIENDNGKHVPWSLDTLRTPSTTEAGELWVYDAERDDKTGEYLVSAEPMARIFLGERGGVKMDRF